MTGGDKPFRSALKPRKRFTWRSLKCFFPRIDWKWN